MEFKTYLRIFKTQAHVFWAILLISVVGAVVWQVTQGARYEATLLLNIGRGSFPITEQYTYDSFYRLQADERFADTVVRWLESPRIVADIYQRAGLPDTRPGWRASTQTFAAKRLSSQVIEVVYADSEAKNLSKLAAAALVVLNVSAENLNEEQTTLGWFRIIGSEPVIRDGRTPLSVALAVGVVLGLFLGFWGALGRHYFSPQKDAHRD